MNKRSGLVLVAVAVCLFLLIEANKVLFQQGPVVTATPRPADAPVTPQLPDNLELIYEIDRSALPELTYPALTLRIDVGQVDAVRTTATRPDGRAATVTQRYDRQTGTVIATTDGARLSLLLENSRDPARAGSFTIAPLKGDAAWAWSHSFDDNVNLEGPIGVLDRYDYRGSLYLIGELIEDNRQADWITDVPAIHSLLADGWSIGNHGWDHECTSEAIGEQTILDGYNRLAEIVATSPRPDYKVTGFAAPCFKGEYHPLIQAMVAQGRTDVLFNEAGGRPLMQVDAGAEDYSADEQLVGGFTFDASIGRDPALRSADGVAEAIERVDWMAAHADATHHFWYNTFSHGHKEAELETLAGHIYDNYGAGGSGEAWVAPADEIYSYLLVRERAVVSSSRVQGSTGASFTECCAHVFLPLTGSGISG